MFALRATYENGQMHLEKELQLPGRYNLVVVFEDLYEPDGLYDIARELPENIQYPGSEHHDIVNFSLSCLEYAYNDDEPEYTDDMLKAVNPEFQL